MDLGHERVGDANKAHSPPEHQILSDKAQNQCESYGLLTYIHIKSRGGGASVTSH